MSKTAWASRGSSLPSDRIPSKAQAAQPAKAKGKQKDARPPKSKEVLRLEKLRDDLRKATGKERDPKGGCFCQARMHPLSTHTPICRACGLILCELNVPHSACPHCGDALLIPAARTVLVDALDTQIADTLAKEDDERARAVQEARAAAGAFPTLSASGAASRASTPGPGPGPDTQAAHPANQTHKVLSLNPKTKRVKVESYTPPALSRAASKEKVKVKQAAEPEYKRVPAPPPEVVVSRTQPDAQRPWANVRGLNVTYVPPARI
ncbi:hypothetical protein V8D89_002007 [Ganoderma adspersum]